MDTRRKGIEFKMICPCEECVLIALCRHKEYLKLFQHCSLIREYLPMPFIKYKHDILRLGKVYDTLTPSKWRYLLSGGVYQYKSGIHQYKSEVYEK